MYFSLHNKNMLYKFDNNNDIVKNKYLLMYLFNCISFFILIEIIHRPSISNLSSFFNPFSILRIFYVILFSVFLSLYAFVFKKPLLVSILHYGFWCVLALISNINFYFKGTPLIFEDVFLVNEAASIASKYINPTIVTNFIILFLFIIVITILLIKNNYNINFEIFTFKNNIVKFFCNILFIVLFIISSKSLLNFGNYAAYSVSDFNLENTYNRNGFIYSFTKSFDTFFENSNVAYDEKIISEIKDKLSKTSYETVTPTENVIVVQLESLFDPLKLQGVTISDDPLKNLHQLSKNNKSGEIIVPVIGGGTTQTEFEILTGINIRNFYTKMPYLNLLNSYPIETVVNIFNQYGYDTTAIHNYFSTFYNRVKAYQNLGFKTFIPLETISKRERNDNYWYKDDLLVNEIINKIKSTENKDFIFTVTVESHGPYTGNIEHKIKAKSDLLTDTEIHELNNYINIEKNVDDFILNLYNALNDLGEEYVLILYSDHLPSLGEKQSTFKKTLPESEFFKTPYLILKSDNTKTLDFNDENMYAHEFLGKVLKSLKINNTIYHKFKTIFKDNENYLNYEKQLLNDTKNNNIYDGNKFPHKIYKITVGNIPKINNVIIKDNIAYISGENFTPNSKIYINGKLEEEEFLSKNYIKLKKYMPKDGDVITTVTLSNKKSPLNTSSKFIFKN